jgi:hypothetical protein
MVDDRPFRVELREEGSAWVVEILDPSGAAVSTRACRDHPEARTYASTVRQHLYWLSPERFREYYRLP